MKPLFWRIRKIGQSTWRWLMSVGLWCSRAFYSVIVTVQTRHARLRRVDMNELSTSLAAVLGSPATSALAAARKVARAERQVQRIVHRPCPYALRLLHAFAMAVDTRPLLGEIDRKPSPVLLALPLTTASIALLADLVLHSERHFCIEWTPLSGLYLPAIIKQKNARATVEFLVPRAMLRRNRSQSLAAHLTTYVTFPDHHFSTTDSSRAVIFLGERHYIPVLEPLLFFRGVSTIFAMRPTRLAMEAGFELELYPEKPSANATEKDAGQLLQWLASRMEAVVKADPGSVLSWVAIYQRVSRRQAMVQLLENGLVEGFIRTWTKSAGSSQAPVLAWCLSELRRKRELLLQTYRQEAGGES